MTRDANHAMIVCVYGQSYSICGLITWQWFINLEMSCNDYRREFKPYCHTYKDGMILWMNSIKDKLIEAGRGEAERRGEGI